tara:strand:- start:450 stop:674 length:225 start_codon:yes stop_codon:yes gene_type:complete
MQNTSTQPSPAFQPAPAQAQQTLMTTPIDSENTALNVLVSFCGLAQRRGAFSLDEAAKIYECIKVFQKNEPVKN